MGTVTAVRAEWKADLSAKGRQGMVKNGTAMPDGSFPTPNLDYLNRAIQSFGRATDPGATKRYLKRRAKALGASREVLDRIDNLDGGKADEPEGLEFKSLLLDTNFGGVEAKVLDADEGIVTAIVAVTGIEDRVRDIIEPGAIGPQLKSIWPIGVVNHDWGSPVARTLEAEELLPGDDRLPKQLKTGEPWPLGAGGLQVKAQYNLETQAGRDAFSNIKFFGAHQDWSVGYKALKAQRGKDGIRRIKSMQTPEYSTVLAGAHPMAATVDVKSMLGVDGETKSYSEVMLPGSIEQRLDSVEDAIEEQILPALVGMADNDIEDGCYCTVVGTFDDHVVFSVGDSSWTVDYTIDQDGNVALGAPLPVTLTFGAAEGKGDDDVETKAQDFFDFLGQIADEVKAGRMISATNMAKLKSGHAAIGDVIDKAEATYTTEDGTKSGAHTYVPTTAELSPTVEVDGEQKALPALTVEFCGICGEKQDAGNHVEAKADAGVGAPGAVDATTHEFKADDDGDCAVCQQPATAPIHDAPYGVLVPGVQASGRQPEGAGGFGTLGDIKADDDEGNETKAAPDDEFELLQLERERMAL